jgi:hypothetical protein
MRATLTRPTQETEGPTTTMSLLDIAGIAGLSTVIAIHTTELAGKTEETSYLGFGYVLLIAASLVSIVMLSQRDARGWLLGGLASAATIIGFVLTRTTGLPNAHGDEGNWSETIAVWSLFAEGIVVLLAVFAFAHNRRS